MRSTAATSLSVRRSGLTLALVLQLGGAAAAFVGAAGVVQLLFPPAAVLLAGSLLLRRRGAAYVEFVIWLWLLAPALRRVVDLHIGWTPVSPIMAAAPAATLLCLAPALMGRRKLDPAIGPALVIGVLSVGYGAAVGMVNVGLGGPFAGILAWLPPLALGLYVAAAGPPDTAELSAVIRRTAVLGTLVLGVYGVVQFVLVPAWDAFWLQNAPIDSAGFPHPFEVRVFSTLNSPAPFASVLGTLLVVLTACRARTRWLSMLAGFVALGLSLVRTAWLGYIVALFSFLSPGRLRLLRSAAVGVGLPVLLLVLYGGPLTEAISKRLSATTASASKDESLVDRLEFYRALLPEVLTDPVGNGLGSVGVSTKLSSDGKLGNLGNFDGGALEVLYTFGLPVGLAFLAATVLAVVAAARVAKRRGDLERAMAAGLLGLLVQLPLANPLTTPSGIFFWLFLGMLARPLHAEPQPAASEPVVTASSVH